MGRSPKTEGAIGRKAHLTAGDGASLRLSYFLPRFHEAARKIGVGYRQAPASTNPSANRNCTARRLPQSPAVTAPSRRELWGQCKKEAHCKISVLQWASGFLLKFFLLVEMDGQPPGEEVQRQGNASGCQSHHDGISYGQSGQEIGLPQGKASTAKGCNQNDKQQSSLLRAEFESQGQQKSRGSHTQHEAEQSGSQKCIQIKTVPQDLPQSQNHQAHQKHPAVENQPHQIFGRYQLRPGIGQGAAVLLPLEVGIIGKQAHRKHSGNQDRISQEK